MKLQHYPVGLYIPLCGAILATNTG
jgi:hypothetical protein